MLLLEDVVNLLVARIELHSISSLFSADFAIFLVRPWTARFFL